jgi:endonuclease/exonuclease/phosphatase (EEP) superfamily protein YafD
VVLAAYPALALGRSLPQDFTRTASLYVALAWAGFMVTVFAFHLGLFLSGVGLLALWCRCRRLALATLPAALVALGPTLWRAPPGSDGNVASTGPSLRLMSVNPLARNRRSAPILEEIRAAQPDVVWFQEYTPRWHRALTESLGREFPHRIFERRHDGFGAAIYSKRRTREQQQINLGTKGFGVPLLRGTVRAAGRRVTLYNVHLLPPRTLKYVRHQRLQCAELHRRLAERAGRVIVAGDFNFTPQTPQAAFLRELGLTEVHDAAGCGRGTTWPAHGIFPYLPPVHLRLDQIDVDGGLAVKHAAVGRGTGSDHRPVTATIGFPANRD